MGRPNETEVFKIRHHIADGSCAEVETRFPRKRPRADRLPIADVTADQQFQQIMRPVIEFQMLQIINGFCHELTAGK